MRSVRGSSGGIIMDNVKHFDKILLFKPQGENTYIRKLSMSYGYYTALAIVDKNEYVTDVGVKNNFRILPFSKLSRRYYNLLGSERCKWLDDDDIMSIYQVVEPLKLKKRYKLLKDCRGMRYTMPEETYEIKRLILHTFSDLHGVDIHDFNKLGEYIDEYRKDIPLDFSNVLYNIDEDYDGAEVSIPLFNNADAVGQTKLI